MKKQTYLTIGLCVCGYKKNVLQVLLTGALDFSVGFIFCILQCSSGGGAAAAGGCVF
jgi:hypothetical protein